MVKDNALRKKLLDLGISSSGSRQLMERRYTEWITLWNANCDSKNPKGKGELKRELDVWERTQGGGAPMASRMNPGGNIRDKDFDGLAWSKNNDDSFKELVAQAKRKRAVKTESEELPKPEAPDVPVPAMGGTPQSPEKQLPSEHQLQEAEATADEAPNQQDAHSNMIPASPPGRPSQRRFFEDNVSLSFEPTSSQQRGMQILDKDIGIGSDLSTLRPLQN